MFFNKKNKVELVVEENKSEELVKEDEMFALKTANDFSIELTKNLLEEEQGTANAIGKVKSTYNQIQNTLNIVI